MASIVGVVVVAGSHDVGHGVAALILPHAAPRGVPERHPRQAVILSEDALRPNAKG